MVSFTGLLFTTTATVLAFASTSSLVSTVHAHGVMDIPKPTYKGSHGRAMDPVSLVPREVLGVYGGVSPDAFAAAMAKTKVGSLRDFILKYAKVEKGATREYGRTDPNGQRQPVPDFVQWSRGENGGLTPSHRGPLEVWCDNALVAKVANTGTITASPARIPIDKAKCQGKNRLTVYWVALHNAPFQVYIQSARLQGGGNGAGADGGDAASDAASTPTPTPARVPTPGNNTSPNSHPPTSQPKTNKPDGGNKFKCSKKI